MCMSYDSEHLAEASRRPSSGVVAHAGVQGQFVRLLVRVRTASTNPLANGDCSTKKQPKYLAVSGKFEFFS